MTSRSALLVSIAALSAAAAAGAACDDATDAESAAPGLDGGVLVTRDASVGPRDGAAAAATLRVAHVARGVGAVDLCYRSATSGTWAGPMFASGRAPPGDAGTLADAGGDGGAALDASVTAGLSPDTLSRYLTIETSGAVTLAIVDARASSCANPLFTGDVTLDPGKLVTVALVGRDDVDASAESALGIVAFIDDRRAAASDVARVRMIHVALGSGGREASPALAVRAVGARTEVVAERVEPRAAASPSTGATVDALGYATIPPVPAPSQLAVGAAAQSAADAAVTSWVSAAGDLGLTGGSLHTGFVLTGADTPFEVLWCSDSSTSGDLTTCSLVR